MEAFVNYSSMDPPMTAKRPRSARDWEDHQETITRLYSQEGNKLAEVIEAMEKEYGFCATYVVFSPSMASLRYVLFWFMKEKSPDVALDNVNTRENYLSGVWAKMLGTAKWRPYYGKN
jgi:hypothetical protein